MSLVALVGNGTAGFLNDLFDWRLGEGESIVGLAGQWIGDVDRRSVKQADQLCVESGGALLAAPQLRVLVVGLARCDGAVD